MPNEIRHKTSTTPGAAPTPTQLVAGELAINAADGKVYTKKVDGTIVELTDLQVMDGGEQFSPLGISNLALWLDASDTSTLYTSELGAVSAVTSPTEITGCVGWWDASDASNITQSGGLVSQLNDKSGLGNHATASGTARPTLTANGLNGRSVLTFDGANTVMRVAANAVFNSNDITYFVVFRQVSSANAGVYTKLNATTGTAGFGFVCRTATFPFTWPLQKNANLSPVISLSGFDPTVGVRVYSVVSSSTASVYVNGAFGTSTASTADHSLNQRVSIGARDGSEILNGYIAEIIHFNVALSDANRARIEKYLAIKWGLTDPHQSVAQATTAATSPLDVGNCALWLDASDAATVTLSAGSVTQWTDKSGNARHFTASSTACPAYAATINGRAVLTFDGVANTLTGNAAAQTVIQNITGYTCFAVVRVNSVAAGERFILGLGSTVIYRLGQQDSRPFIGGRRTGAETLRSVTAASGTLTTGITYVLSSVVNHPTTTLTGFSRGVSFGTDTAYMDTGNTPATALSINIGTQGGGTYGFFNGDIAEVIVFNTALSSSDRARIEKYLANKWGGTSGIEPTPAIGSWHDKSGNSRHATQATAANRPVRSTTSINNLRAVGFDGTAQRFVLPAMDSTPSTVFAVVRHAAGTTSAARTPICFGDGVTYMCWQLQQTGSIRVGVTYNLPQTNFTTDNVDPRGGVFVLTGQMTATGGGRLGRFIGSSLPLQQAMQDAGNGVRIGCRFRTADDLFWSGEVCEVVHYQDILSLAQVQQIERYLAAKWGITLAPQVSNLDAQDWLNRVYAAGSTVTQGTAAAVNNFCNAIDSAGLRDRFYRLNLFCGDNLTACLVPLYRGPSLTATQLGNTTDTNNNFAASDYAETGASGGLIGNGSSKYLNTGFNPVTASASDSDFHLWAYTSGGEASGTTRGVMGTLAGSNETFLGWASGGTQETGVIAGSGVARRLVGSGALSGSMAVVASSGKTLQAYYNGSASAAGTATATNSFADLPMFVFALNSSGSPTQYALARRFRAYSFGLGLSGSQATAYHTALTTFQTALGRQV